MDGSTVHAQDGGQLRLPPYVSYATFKTLIADLKEHILPARIDRSVLTRFSGSVGTQLMSALRFLKLVDANNAPTDKMHDLVNSYGTDQWQPTLAMILRDVYGPMFAIDLTKATPAQFSETFIKSFPAKEGVTRRCIIFFLPAIKDAGIPISERIVKGKKLRTTNPRPRIPRRSAGAATPPTPTPPPSPPSATTIPPAPPTAFQLTAMIEPDMTPEEMAAVWTLLQYTKKKEAATSNKK